MDAVQKRKEANLASQGNVPKIQEPGDVWNVTFRRARYVGNNRRFLKRRLTSASHAYFRHANAAQNDLAVQSIEAPTNTWRRGLAANAGKGKWWYLESF